MNCTKKHRGDAMDEDIPNKLSGIRSDEEWGNGKVEIKNEEIEIESPECIICNDRGNLELHHVEPRSDGGSDSADNLVHICKDCHDIIHSKPSSALNEDGGLKDKYREDSLVQFIKSVYGYDMLLKSSRCSPALKRIKEAVKKYDKERGIEPDWETGERCPNGVFPSAKIHSNQCEKSVIDVCEKTDCPYYSDADSIFEIRGFR